MSRFVLAKLAGHLSGGVRSPPHGLASAATWEERINTTLVGTQELMGVKNLVQRYRHSAPLLAGMVFLNWYRGSATSFVCNHQQLE